MLTTRTWKSMRESAARTKLRSRAKAWPRRRPGQGARGPRASQPPRRLALFSGRTSSRARVTYDRLVANVLRDILGTLGAWFIYCLIWAFGRRVQLEEVPWLAGPVGGSYIGDRPYEECAERERLELERDATQGGLVPDFSALAGPSFDPAAVDPGVRAFYEHTAEHRMDVWSRTFFPANVALWLLVSAISRRVNQLNFPLHPIEAAKGMLSEIVLLRRPDGSIRYTGWFRRLAESGYVVYTGFYMTESVPAWDSPCVKVVFPMPEGNATVILRPKALEDGSLELSSAGRGFGDAGFYRIQRSYLGGFRIWRVRTLDEYFRVYVDEDRVLRCDHHISFLGLRVLRLHYRMQRLTEDPARSPRGA